MKRRVFEVPAQNGRHEYGQVLVCVVPERDEVTCAVRRFSSDTWSRPMPMVLQQDDPPEARPRSNRYVERAVEAMAPKSLGDAMRAIGRYTESEGGDSPETQQARSFLFDLYTAWVDVGRPELSG